MPIDICVMTSFFEKIKTGIGIDAPAPDFPADLAPLTDSSVPAKEKKPQKIKVEKKPDRPKKVPQPEEEAKEKTEDKKKKWFEPEGQLTVDVYQTENELVIQSAIAGVKPEELDITAQGDVVIIKGVREKPVEEENGNYFYQECYWGPFSRQIILPVEADPARSKATIKEGVLTIRMPKIEREKERKIAVKGH